MYRPLFTASRLDSIMRCRGASTLPYIEEKPRDAVLALAGTSEHATVLTVQGLSENLREWLFVHGISRIHFEESFTVDFSYNYSRLSTSSYQAGVPNPSDSGGTPDVFTVYIRDFAQPCLTTNQEHFLSSDGEHCANCSDTKLSKSLIFLRLPDLKTGIGQASGTLPAPQDSWQLRYYVLAVLLWLGWPYRVALGSCDVAWFTRDFESERDAEPELDPADRAHRWRITDANLSEQLLTDSLAELRDLTIQLTSRPADSWREGPWCETCPVFKACPVQKSPVQRLGVALEAAGGNLTPEAIASVYEALGPVRRLIEQAEIVCDRFVANQGPVSTRSGFLRRERLDRRTVSPEGLRVLKEAYPTEYSKMVRESTSASRIAQAMGERVPGAATAAVMRRLEGVRGAVVESSSFVLRERRDRSE